MLAADSLRVEVQGTKVVVAGRQSVSGLFCRCCYIPVLIQMSAHDIISKFCVADGRSLFNRGMPRGVFKTMHRLPVGADPHSLLASFTDGVLRINMRKQV